MLNHIRNIRIHLRSRNKVGKCPNKESAQLNLGLGNLVLSRNVSGNLRSRMLPRRNGSQMMLNGRIRIHLSRQFRLGVDHWRRFYHRIINLISSLRCSIRVISRHLIWRVRHHSPIYLDTRWVIWRNLIGRWIWRTWWVMAVWRMDSIGIIQISRNRRGIHSPLGSWIGRTQLNQRGRVDIILKLRSLLMSLRMNRNHLHNRVVLRIYFRLISVISLISDKPKRCMCWIQLYNHLDSLVMSN